MATETVTFPVSIITNLMGELSFDNESALAHFAEVTAGRVSVQLELLLKQFNKEDDGMVEIVLESIADQAMQVSGAMGFLSQLRKEKARV